MHTAQLWLWEPGLLCADVVPKAQWQGHHSASTILLQEVVPATECRLRLHQLQPTPGARALRLTLSGTCLGVDECGVLIGAPQSCMASVHGLSHAPLGNLLSSSAVNCLGGHVPWGCVPPLSLAHSPVDAECL